MDMDFLLQAPEVGCFSVTYLSGGKGIEYYEVKAVYPEERIPEPFKVKFSVPHVDIYSVWSPSWFHSSRFDRRLGPNWSKRSTTSRLASWMPLHALVSSGGKNRMAVALSNAETPVTISTGVREETANVEWEIEFFSMQVAPIKTYSAIIRIDTRDIPYYDALYDVVTWWETDCGYTPAYVPEHAKLPMNSLWYSYHQHTIAEELEAECAQAAQDGFGCVIVDDGWQTMDTQRGYAYCGDWEPLKIPDMRAHVERVHQLGMKYMLWYSVPFVGKHSRAFERFRDMHLAWDERLGTATLDPRFPEVREYLIDIYEKAMREWDLDGFKLDFIDSFRATRISPLYREGMDCRTVEEAVVRLMTGVKDALQKIKPEALIEFRQSYIGPAMRLYGNMFRVGDCPDDILSNRVGMVDLRLLMGSSAVHSDMLMWHPQETVENAAVQIQNILFAVPQISVRLAELPQEHRRMLGFWMDFIRKHRQLLAAPIRAESPHQLYPLVRTRCEAESMIAVYEAGYAAELDDAETTWVINAADPRGVIVDAPAACQAELFDCMGQFISKQEAVPGLQRLSVPLGGYVQLTKA